MELIRLSKVACADRRASPRFPLTLEVRYALTGSPGPVKAGSGHTIDLSSSGLRFNADRPLLTGQKLEVSIDWPVVLDGDAGLQLIMSGLVVRTNETATALRIYRHEFRTSRVGLKNVPPQESVG